MSIDEIEKAITELSPKERARIFARLEAMAEEEWDRQIEADAKNGRLDKFVAESEAEFRSGNFKKL